MEVITPFNSNFDPKNCYFSAPPTPSHLYDDSCAAESTIVNDGDDFVFDVSQDWETASLPAEELFDGGVIKSLRPPPQTVTEVEVEVMPRRRGRERVSKSASVRATRSLPRLRDHAPSWEEEERDSGKGKGQKKWKLMDFFLFRSASEGRAYPLKKYTAAGSGSRQVSAHEVLYTTNRAVSENLKRKTFLPYKQGILGRLAFNPAVHALANGFGFSRK